MLPKSLALSFVGLLFVTIRAWAGTSVEGAVKDPSERPVNTGFSSVETSRGPAVQQTVIRVSGVH